MGAGGCGDDDDGYNGWWIDFAAGWVSGAAGVVACQPLDTLLTRYQAGGTVTAAAGTTTVSLRGLARELGDVRSLWRGSSPMIGAVPLQNALLMGGYGFGKKCGDRISRRHRDDDGIDDEAGSAQRLVPIFAGGCAGGVLQAFLMSPVEWIKVQQQTGAVDAAAVVAADGRRRAMTTIGLAKILWRDGNGGGARLRNRGLAATLLRDGIPHGVWFAAYDWCKNRMTVDGRRKADDDDKSPPAAMYERITVPLASGAFAATAAWAVGYPFDIIKTRIQAATTAMVVAPSSSSSSVRSVQPPGVLATARQLVAEADGRVLRGLYRGFGWKLLRSIPASMIGFLTYEVASDALA